jgi:ATP-binding protein involved in chromosome partitioning
MTTPQEILDDLKNVKYPGYSRDIVSFGLVRDIEVGSATVTIALAPGGASESAVKEITGEIEKRARQLTGIENIEIRIEQPERPVQREPARRTDIEGVRRIIAVASGKGGVGKSTVAVNLALALRGLGRKVGLLDADVYGPSVPTMLGLDGRAGAGDDERIKPLEGHGIAAISMGMLINRRQPVIWRGPMITKLLTQFFRDVDWGELDYLVLDLPPGTGDAQLTIAQQVPLSGGVIVTTPQDVALLDVQRGIAMFNQVGAPVLGVVENMSYHICGDCGHRSEIFGHGGGAKMAADTGIPFLGEVPLVRAIREGSDSGAPIVATAPDSPHAEAFIAIARRVEEEVENQGRTELPTIQ